MKNTVKLPFVLLCCIILSCGQRDAIQQAREQQFHDDSLKAAVIVEMNSRSQSTTSPKEQKSENSASKDQDNVSPSNGSDPVTKKEAAELASKESQITDAKLKLNKLNILLVNANTKLEYEKNELTRAEQFHIGRLKGTRENEIRSQDLRVQACQNYVQKIHQAIAQEHEKISSLQNEINQ